MNKFSQNNFFKGILSTFAAAILITQLALYPLADSSAETLNGYDQINPSSDASSISNNAVPTPSTNASAFPSSVSDGPYTPNESGEVMVLMFHHFIESYTGGDRKNTITLDGFREFLQRIYDQGYRPVSMEEVITNSINLPKGYRPIVFTFDDGWASQFSFIEVDGQLQVDPNTAVGILEEFQRQHSDFNLRGMFFVNLGQNTFGQVGTINDRLHYLIDKGFEIGNHTYKHGDLKKMNQSGITAEIGQNQSVMNEIIPGYQFSALALPYGSNNKPEIQTIASGNYNGVSYNNQLVFLAGWKPMEIPGTTDATFVSTRIIAPGLDPLEMDANWWLIDAQNNPGRYYVSDGDMSVTTIPENKVHLLTPETQSTRQIVITSAI